jgi:hypothetical protein
MINARSHSKLPAAAELLEGVLLVPIGFVISSTVFPGFLLCVPGLTLLAAMVAVPLVAVALVVSAAGILLMVVAGPFALSRLILLAIRDRLARRRIRAHAPIPVSG